MQGNKAKIFAPSKVAIHKDRIDAYLKGEKIYPVTMEMDLTQRCTRACPACPYSAARSPGLTLDLPFLNKLFSILGAHTPGLVLSGGEPTLTPHFPETVKLARKRGFKEVAVISNGSRLNIPEIQDALVEHVTSIRISMYDWQNGDSEYFTETLGKITNLRKRIEKEGSKLQIGASILTRKEWNHKYKHIALKALDAGVDWVYFHPFCIDWDKERPTQADQTGVLRAIEELKEQASPNANIQVPYERYSEEPLFFRKLHGAHFLIQVGADGCNYAGPECKYEKDFKLLDLNEYMEDDFLWQTQRLEILSKINSENYRFIGTKHRPSVFSDYIEKIIKLNENVNENSSNKETEEFSYPEII
jgi:organic radical activating enzyme